MLQAAAMRATDKLLCGLTEANPDAAARILEAFAAEEAGRAFNRLNVGSAAMVLGRMTPELALAAILQVKPERRTPLLEHMVPHVAVRLLRLVEPDTRTAWLEPLGEKLAAPLRALIAYPPDTAGGTMDPIVTTLPVDIKVGEAVSVLRKAPRSTVVYLYVVDRDQRLEGVVGIRDLLLASPKDPIAPLVNRDVTSIPAELDRDLLAETMQRSKLLALPVIDHERHLLGVVRHDQVIRAVQTEAFEDMLRIVGAGVDERALSRVSVVIKRRLPWLYVNLFTAFIAAAVVGLFEGVIAQVTALAVLLPIVAGQAGNSGAQTLAVVIRGLALKEISQSNLLRLMGKEILGGFLNGIAIAAVTSGAVYLWDGRWGLALVIGLSMIVNMVAAGLAGAIIPLILVRLGRDPAQSSSIFLTTVTDVVGFASFLGLALLLAPLIH
ncbi:MAG: magnesium transporter [Deltaproteobacteria bacterium RIFOXYB12_FULL_58_9]|nr:MAG: magnesium transporter [Deltaproteobacteria bacterium RIFOXYB12_FULL_58_9]